MKRTKSQAYPTSAFFDGSIDDETFGGGSDDEDAREASERCVGVSLNDAGMHTYGRGRMRRRAVEESEDFEGLPTEAPPGYARS